MFDKLTGPDVERSIIEYIAAEIRDPGPRNHPILNPAAGQAPAGLIVSLAVVLQQYAELLRAHHGPQKALELTELALHEIDLRESA